MTATPDETRPQPDKPPVVIPAGKRLFIRLHRNISTQHVIFVVCFILLALTGFMVNLPGDVLDEFGIGQTVFVVRSNVHRVCAVIMVLVCVYHAYWVAFRPAGRGWIRDMMPGRKDLTDMRENMAYYLGRRDSMPEFDRFCYKHKAEYFALIAGNVLMTVSGVLLWTEYNWSKFVLDIATVVHGMEAVLACLAILVWHMYEVHLRPHKFPGDKNWMKGVISEEEMKEEYAGHYQKIMADPKLQDIYIINADEPRARRRR